MKKKTIIIGICAVCFTFIGGLIWHISQQPKELPKLEIPPEFAHQTLSLRDTTENEKTSDEIREQLVAFVSAIEEGYGTYSLFQEEFAEKKLALQVMVELQKRASINGTEVLPAKILNETFERCLVLEDDLFELCLNLEDGIGRAFSVLILNEFDHAERGMIATCFQSYEMYTKRAMCYLTLRSS